MRSTEVAGRPRQSRPQLALMSVIPEMGSPTDGQAHLQIPCSGIGAVEQITWTICRSLAEKPPYEQPRHQRQRLRAGGRGH